MVGAGTGPGPVPVRVPGCGSELRRAGSRDDGACPVRRSTCGCPQWRHEAAAYVLGALTPGDRRRYEAHLRSCPACRGEGVAGLAGLPGLLRRLSAQQAGDQP